MIASDLRIAFTVVTVTAVVVGFGVMLVLASYVGHRRGRATVSQVVSSGDEAEDRVADLRDSAIADMFDAARHMRLQRLLSVDDHRPDTEWTTRSVARQLERGDEA